MMRGALAVDVDGEEEEEEEEGVCTGSADCMSGCWGAGFAPAKGPAPAFAGVAVTGAKDSAGIAMAAACGSDAGVPATAASITAANPRLPIAAALLTCTVDCSAVWRGFMWR